MQLRDYQVPAVEFLSSRVRALVQAPAGSGKTVIGAVALAKVWSDAAVGPLEDVVWVANTLEQVAQARAALASVMASDLAARVCVKCAASEPDTSRASLLVVDECHHAPAVVWRRMIEAAPSGCRVWGLSATPFCGDAERDAVVRSLFGEPWVVDRGLLVERGQLARARVRWLRVNAPGEFTRRVEEMAGPEIERRLRRFSRCSAQETRNRVLWQVCQEVGVVKNRDRNRAAYRTANEHVLQEDSVLVLVGQVAHAQAFARMIPGAVAVWSGMGARKRREALAGFAAGTVPCVVATSLADEGLDVPRANVLVLVSAGRSANKLEQRTGRVLRAWAGKGEGLIYDFDDVGHYFLAAQSKARLRTYRRLGYAVEG